jgi:hypothetical protein
MAENTKMPPNQDQRQRTPRGNPSQKPGGPAPSGAGPDRNRPAPGKEVPGKDPGQGSMDDDDLEEGVTPPIDRE